MGPGAFRVYGTIEKIEEQPDGTIVVSDSTMASSGVRIFTGGVLGAPLAAGLRLQSTHGLACY